MKNTNYRLLYEPNDDGVTHINIYSKAKTELGRMLSHFYSAVVEVPEFGSFDNMECFWQYLSTGCQYEMLRHLTGVEAKMRSKGFPKVFRDDFMEQIKAANRLKLLQHPEILQPFVESSLPFEHYYLMGRSQVLQRPVDAHTIIAMFESLRCEFKENQSWQIPSHNQLSEQGQTTNSPL